MYVNEYFKVVTKYANEYFKVVTKCANKYFERFKKYAKKGENDATHTSTTPEAKMVDLQPLESF